MRSFWRHLLVLVMKGECLWVCGQNGSRFLARAIVCMVGSEMGDIAIEGG